MTQPLAKMSADDVIGVVVDLPRPVPPVLAVGAFLKNTLCLANDRPRWFPATSAIWRPSARFVTSQSYAERMLTIAGDLPVVVAHDLHPDFHSTRWAEAFSASMGVEAVPVQHHHAHVAAVMAEHGIEEPTLGLALDGFGLGPNNEAWGGELLCVDSRRLPAPRPPRATRAAGR